MLRILIFLGLKLYEIAKFIWRILKWILIALFPVCPFILIMFIFGWEINEASTNVLLFIEFVWIMGIVTADSWTRDVKYWFKDNWLKAGLIASQIKEKHGRA